jgi:serine/threonine-protein kinase ATR
MAPRSRTVRPTQSGFHNGMELTNADHLPPPSTIAAQIVHNRSTVARQEPENKALFGKLLQEYLRDPIIEDSNVDTNAQLIQVVAEAGLDVLLSDDPFAPDNLLEHAKDSLLVLRLTITRKPDVLLYQEDADSKRPPLLLWILAKVLNLMGRRNLGLIQLDLEALLSTILTVLSSKNHTMGHAIALRNMLNKLVEGKLDVGSKDSNIADIVTDVLYTLENQEASHETEAPSLHVVLPSASIMAGFWPAASSLLVLPSAYQADIRNSVQAYILIIRLLAVFRNTLAGDVPLLPSNPLSEAWLFDCCHRVLDLCACASGTANGEVYRVITVIADLCYSIMKTRCPKRNINSIVDLIISMLEHYKPGASPDLVTALNNLLSCLFNLYSTSPTQMLYLRQALLPDLQRLMSHTSQNQEDVSAYFLSQAIETLTSRATSEITETRPPKRQRLEPAEPDRYDQHRAKLIKEVNEELSGSSRTNLPELEQDAVDRLSQSDDSHRSSILIALGLLPCLTLRCLVSAPDGVSTPRCRICDTGHPYDKLKIAISSPGDDAAQLCRRLLSFLSLCIEDARLRRSKSFRVAAANAIRRISSHLDDPECSMLDWKGIGPWLMRSLQSSARELRIASAKALVSYLREGLQDVVRTRNRLDTLDFLKCLAEKNNLTDQETLTFAWGLIGKTCGDTELNLALIQLIDYLGHSHSLVSGAAYHEILELAESRKCTPFELLKPYWGSLATHVVKDIYACPQKVQQLAEIVALSVNDLLLMTQVDTVPFLVLTRKKDVLQRIAQARGPSITVQDLWLQPSRNLAAVLALLLVQPSEDSEQSAIALLKDVSPSFQEDDLSALVKVDPILIACEIVKHASNCPEAKKPLAYQGLRLLAAINERKPGSSKSSKSGKYLSSFLEAHILGIMSHFTDIIDAPIERQPLADKSQALRAVEQLIIVGRSQVGIAIPQIRATLQSVSKIPSLVDSAFLTWSALVAAAGYEEIESLVDQTFAVIVHHWDSFTPATQRRAYDVISVLLKDYNSMIRDRIQMLPSLAGIEVLHKFESEISRFKTTIDPLIHFEAYSQRCRDENPVIVHRALIDLAPFLELHQKVIHESAVSQQPSPVIARLSRALLDAAVHFKESDAAIPELAAKCLGAIGSIDPNRVDHTREKHEILMLSNFEKASEVIDFVADMLEQVLVDAFHSAPTGRAQTYLAYTMQELLKFCGFRSILYKPRSSQAGPVYQRWRQIPESVRSTLTPFFNTKYMLVHPSMPGDSEVFPVYKSGMTHATWLRTFVFNLLHKATTENAQLVFPVLSRVIWGQDISIPTFLLPFVVLNVVVGGNDDDIGFINAEFLQILSIDVEPLVAEEIKQCSEVSDIY